MTTTTSHFSCRRVSQHAWATVEDDRWKQYPILYAVVSDNQDHVVLIDSGTGSNSYLEWLKTSSPEELRKAVSTGSLTLMSTHIHFDHVGENWKFPGACLMSGAAKAFTRNSEITSLAQAFPGTHLIAFEVSRWLNDGDRIEVDPSIPLEVLQTPGHTPDSLSLFLACDRLLFIGDLLYPYTAIYLDCLGSDLNAYRASIEKLKTFVQHKSISPAVSTLCEMLGGVNPELAKSQGVDLEQIIALCEGNLDTAIDLLLTSGADPSKMMAQQQSVSEIRLACGHVESSLSALPALETVLETIRGIIEGRLHPISIEEDSQEYASPNRDFTFFVPKSRRTTY